MNFDRIDEILARAAELKAKHDRMGHLLVELQASIIHQCGLNLEHPKARAVFIQAKTEELARMRVRRSRDGKRLFNAINGLPLYSFSANRAYRILDEIQRAEALDKPVTDPET